MALDLLRMAEHVHGHLGWLAAAALVHPAIVLRPRRRGALAIDSFDDSVEAGGRLRRSGLSVVLATSFVTCVSALGGWLYVAYRQQLKRDIFASAPAVGLLFERKEHLAFVALVLAWAGTAAFFTASRTRGRWQTRFSTIAFRAFAGSAALAIIVASLGTLVAVHRSFP
jgi:hypothetical protein